MRIGVLILLAVSAGFAADEVQLALTLKAETDYDRVQLSANPQLHDTSACIQSQAALLPVAPRTEIPLVHFRKGFCTLLGATITHQAADFNAAAAEFDASVQSWAGRIEKPPKGILVEPPSSALPVLAAIARLESNPAGDSLSKAGSAIQTALARPDCPASVMPAKECQEILQIGRQWLGWIALRGNHLEEAASQFQTSGWPQWVAGKQAFEKRDYRRAAEQYRLAIQAWNAETSPTLAVRLGPQPDLGLALSDLGGAQLLAGDTAGAIATLDSAIKRDPDHAWSFYLRARAKEAAGQPDAALADYNFASRTAFAGAHELVSGDAHLYRGILLYRRKDFSHAEDEFSSALNFEISPNLRADAAAWRHLAAVAEGSCGIARDQLQKSLAAASPFFPAQEAQAMMTACPTTAAAGAPGANSPK